MTERELYRLIELLDTEITHYEFFLGKKPVNKIDWSDDKALLAAIPELSGCMHGWPSQQVFDCNYQLLNLSSAEFEFLQACNTRTVGEILADVEMGLDEVRSILSKQLILLTPGKI